jgi:hypothetical protein
MAAMSSNLGGLALGRPANTEPNPTESALYAAEWTWSICGQVSLFEFFAYAEQCKIATFFEFILHIIFGKVAKLNTSLNIPSILV